MEKHIILVGFMGAGKTTVGQQLAEALEVPFTDSDQWIEAKEHMTVAEIFATKGEAYFREREQEFVVALSSLSPQVIAVGGGLPCRNDHMEQLKAAGKVFYLNVSVMMLVKRVMAEREKRPLLAHLSDQEVSAFVFDTLIERTTFYRKAHVIIPNEGANVDVAVKDILKYV